jgi:MFS family permease
VSLLFNFSIEASLVFLPLYANDLGASDLDVGLIAASYGMAYFVSSFFFGRQSDIQGRLRFIRLGLILSAAAYPFQIIAPGPVALLATRGAIGFCLGIPSAALMAYVYEAEGRVGRFASYGSLGWLFGALAAATIRNYEGLFVASAVASALAFSISLTLREEQHSHISVTGSPAAMIWANRKVYFPFFLRQLGAQAIWAIFPLFLRNIGASRLWIAMFDGINMGVQFIAMQFVERFNAARVFTTGLLLSSLVFVVYGIASHYLQLIPAQVLIAIAWSCLFVGAMSFLLRRNVEHGTAAGLLYSTTYLSAGLGPFLGGALAQLWGFDTVMYVGSALAFVGLLLSPGLKASEG